MPSELAQSKKCLAILLLRPTTTLLIACLMWHSILVGVVCFVISHLWLVHMPWFLMCIWGCRRENLNWIHRKDNVVKDGKEVQWGCCRDATICNACSVVLHSHMPETLYIVYHWAVDDFVWTSLTALCASGTQHLLPLCIHTVRNLLWIIPLSPQLFWKIVAQLNNVQYPKESEMERQRQKGTAEDIWDQKHK